MRVPFDNFGRNFVMFLALKKRNIYTSFSTYRIKTVVARMLKKCSPYSKSSPREGGGPLREIKKKLHDSNHPRDRFVYKLFPASIRFLLFFTFIFNLISSHAIPNSFALH